MRLTLRDFTPADEPELLRLFADCDDWFQAATGHPSGPGDVQGLFYALPEGAAFEQKRLLVAQAEGMIGFVDLVLDHPVPGEAGIRFFLVPKDLRRWGIGREMARALTERYPRIRRVHVPLDDFQPGNEFLKALGFTLNGQRAVLEIAPRSDGR
ncbi:Acetyltransferase (GNAT) domain-containing protein [Lentzea xinjiangensis]|uniref:Acetyltransferase (GNAT) domain-containing protein n=1 Tax=Lentzea xinjiangensis TaxID=402600 RepID=A0A1H9HKS7_9PSEU|nr:GNAT family N-acetyltransferase [Lentzea xinjiangensis]SEQ62822.1 Acetyltransferase (GNAT) domain-containing protein [Lentzea xinjiangensis]